MFDISLEKFVLFFTFLIFVLIVSTVFYAWYFKAYFEFPSCRLENRIPYWILKQVPLTYACFQELIKQAKRHEREGVFALWMGSPTLIVYGDEILKNIINEKAANDKPWYYKLFEFAFGRSILTRNGEEWKKKFKMAAPSMHVRALKTYTNIMNRHSEELIERLSALDGQSTDDTLKMLSLCAMGTIFESNLGGKETTTEEFSSVIKGADLITEFMLKRAWTPWLMFDFSLQLFPSARRTHKICNDILEEILQPKLEKIKQSVISRQASPQRAFSDQALNGKDLKTFGESLVEQHLEDPNITMEEVARQVLLLMGAAFDTVTHSLEYTLFFLGLHNDVQDRAFEEVMYETEGHVTYEDQQRLNYLECVIKESLRMFPAVPIVGRVLSKEVKCGKYTLPKNTRIAVLTYSLHRNPEVFPDPDKFNPERFMEKNSKIKPWNFIPFAEGTRQCMGKNYAMVEMKIILAHILRNFKVTTLDALEDEDFNCCIVLHRMKRLWLKFDPRTSSEH